MTWIYRGVCVCVCVHMHAFSHVLISFCCSLWTMDSSLPGSPLSWGFYRQGLRSGLLLPTPGDLPDPGINLGLFHFLHWRADSLPLHHLGKPCTCVYSWVSVYTRINHAQEPGKVVPSFSPNDCWDVRPLSLQWVVGLGGQIIWKCKFCCPLVFCLLHI